MDTDKDLLFEIRIPTPDGRWVRYGPPFRSIVAADHWMQNGAIRDYLISPIRETDPLDVDWT